MDILLLVVATIAPGLYSVLSAIFARKNSNGFGAPIIFNIGLCLASAICWAFYFGFNFEFDPMVLLYSLGVGAAFFLTFFFAQLSYENGPIALTTLIINFALIIIVIWGFIFWGAPVVPLSICGICLVAVSLVMCLLKKGQNQPESKISLKWIIFISLATIGNAAGSIVMRQESMAFKGKYIGELMFFAMIFALIFCLIFFLFKKKDVKIESLKTTWWLPLVSGILSFLNTFLVLLLASSSLSPSVIYPVICVGSIFIATLYSYVFAKEKLSILQIIGFAVGVAGIVCLSI